MRTGFFGSYLQRDDDFFDAWSELFGDEPDGAMARFLEQDPDTGWGCEITDNNDHTIHCEEFDTEDELREWLTRNNVEID